MSVSPTDLTLFHQIFDALNKVVKDNPKEDVKNLCICLLAMTKHYANAYESHFGIAAANNLLEDLDRRWQTLLVK